MVNQAVTVNVEKSDLDYMKEQCYNISGLVAKWMKAFVQEKKNKD